jgi:predicted CoA-binding protein
MMKTTLVLGATEKEDRYGNIALKRLLRYSQPVKAIGIQEGNVDGVPIHVGTPAFDDIDTVTLYLNPKNQEHYLDYIISLKPRRIIFNPGTENPKLENLARQNGIEPIEACTLVMLSTGQY